MDQLLLIEDEEPTYQSGFVGYLLVDIGCGRTLDVGKVGGK
jgi:hypothetical protein